MSSHPVLFQVFRCCFLWALLSSGGYALELAPKAQPVLQYRPPAEITSVAVSADKRFFATTSINDSAVLLWDAPSGLLLRKFNVVQPQTPAFSPDGRQIAIPGDSEVTVFDVAGGERLLTIAGRGNVLYSGDGRALVVRAGNWRETRLLRVPTDLRRASAVTAAELATLGGQVIPIPDNYTCGTSLSDGGRSACFDGASKSLLLIDTRDGQIRRQAFPQLPGSLNVAISPSGKRVIATDTQFEKAYLFDADSLQLIGEISLPAHYSEERVRNNGYAVFRFPAENRALLMRQMWAYQFDLSPFALRAKTDMSGGIRGNAVQLDASGSLMVVAGITSAGIGGYADNLRLPVRTLFNLYNPTQPERGVLRRIGVPRATTFRPVFTRRGLLLPQRFRDRARVVDLVSGQTIFERDGLHPIADLSANIHAKVDASGTRAYFGYSPGGYSFINDAFKRWGQGELVEFPSGKKIPLPEKIFERGIEDASFTNSGRYLMFTSVVANHLVLASTGELLMSISENSSQSEREKFMELVQSDLQAAAQTGDNSCGGIRFAKHDTEYCAQSNPLEQSQTDISFRTVSGKTALASTRLDAAKEDVFVSENSEQMLLHGTDGASRLFDTRTGKLLATLVAGTDDWAIFSDDGYYATSKGAHRLVGLNYAGKAYFFEDFDLELNRPDLIRQRLGASPALVKALQRAHAKRVQRHGGQIAADKPRVALDTRNLPLATDSPTLEIGFSASAAAGHRVLRQQIYVNGVPVLGRDGLPLDAGSSRQTIALVSGDNRIQVSVSDERGVESLRDSWIVRHTGAPSPITRYVLAVGVSQYADAALNLDYAAKDARDLAVALQRGSPGIERTVVKTLTDAEVSRDKLREARQFFADAKAQDQAIVFIAGHGVLDDKDDYYFAGHDVDAADPAAKGVPLADIEDLFADTKARRRLLLLDSCHSGEVDRDMEQKLAALPRGVSGTRALKLKSAAPATGDAAPDPAQNLAYVSELFADLRRGMGATVLASASGIELALESAQFKNGLFTAALLEALNDPSTDTDGTRSIEMSELRDRVAARVQTLSNGTQTPSTRVENYDENLLMSAWGESAKAAGKKKRK